MVVLQNDLHKTRKESYQGSQLVTFSFHVNTSPNATALVIGDWAGAALVGYSVPMTQQLLASSLSALNLLQESWQALLEVN